MLGQAHAHTLDLRLGQSEHCLASSIDTAARHDLKTDDVPFYNGVDLSYVIQAEQTGFEYRAKAGGPVSTPPTPYLRLRMRMRRNYPSSSEFPLKTRDDCCQVGDAVQIVAKNGANIARLRIWNDPPYPNQTYANVTGVIAMAKRGSCGRRRVRTALKVEARGGRARSQSARTAVL